MHKAKKRTPSVLIIGRLPPPIGGVAMHVQRLTGQLAARNFPHHFCALGATPWTELLLRIAFHRIIHLHISNPLLQLLFAMGCRLTGKKLIITYHGQWGRYGRTGNSAVRWSAYLATVPVVQDDHSLLEAARWNLHARKISTYIPDRSLIEPCHLEIANRAKKYEATFCTNAWNVTFDKEGHETYGITELIQCFAAQPHYQLFVSDPSGNYERHFEAKGIAIPENIVLISHLHDFQSILKSADAFIRHTTTDGVSLSIHEAYEWKIPVLASDAVERPAFCAVYHDIMQTDLKAKLEEARRRIQLPVTPQDHVEELMKLYQTTH